MNSPLNKSSAYVQSIVDFTLDTKPYHSKLTEVVVEYHFEDRVNVRIVDRDVKRILTRATNMYEYFSGGAGDDLNFPFQRTVIPELLRVGATYDNGVQRGSFKVGRDENTDLVNVPFAFDKRKFDGEGVADVVLTKGAFKIPLSEGQDFFQSHGSFEFRTSQSSQFATGYFEQTYDNTYTFPLLVTIDVGTTTGLFIVGPATEVSTTQIEVLGEGFVQVWGLANPNELVWQQTNAIGTLASVQAATGHIFAQNDASLRETGRIIYDDSQTANSSMFITNVVSDQVNGDEWYIECIDDTQHIWSVTGSHYGFAGFFSAAHAPTPTPFDAGVIAFTFLRGSTNASVGDRITLTPKEKLCLAQAEAPEVWNIIQVNPISHSRAQFISTRYGHIVSPAPDSVIGAVKVVDITIPDGTIILTARADGLTFDVTHTSGIPLTPAIATVGVPYAGPIAFTLVNGSVVPFAEDDRFYINIINAEPEVLDLGLYFGYDIEPFDAPDLVYNNFELGHPDYNRKLNFSYDSRFSDYDLSLFNLQLTQAAVDGRMFRIVAKPDRSIPTPLTEKKNGAAPSNWVDLTALNDAGPIVPDPLYQPVFALDGSGNPIYGITDPDDVDIKLYYVSTFKVLYSDDSLTWVTAADDVPAGSTFVDASLGVSFTIAPGNKPFIAANIKDGSVGGMDDGDVFAFTVQNPLPYVDPTPISLVSANVPRAILHSDGFFRAPAADWAITFVDNNRWNLSGTYTAGSNVGNPVAPSTGSILPDGAETYEGLSFKNDLMHFTLKPGFAGFDAGDTFVFSTYEYKPELLVHGSLSGWQENAKIGGWYWNGKIGFHYDLPRARTTNPTSGAPDTISELQINYLRPDCPSTVYNFERTTDRYWVTSGGRGFVGHCEFGGSFKDTYIDVTLNGDPNRSFNINIVADEFSLFKAKDVVILKSPVDAFIPEDGDFVTIIKDHQGRLGMNLIYDATTVPDVSELNLTSIDPNFHDSSTGSILYPIGRHSPEVEQTRNWLPLIQVAKDSTSSIAYFTDTATRIELFAAATGELVGTSYADDSANINWPWRFEWDATFASNYLPLNSQAFITTFGTGLDEKVRVNVSEKLNFLIKLGGGSDTALFGDIAVVDILDTHTMDIDISQIEDIHVVVADSPFDGFLPGWDNLPHDAEDAMGFDEGSLGIAPGFYDATEDSPGIVLPPAFGVPAVGHAFNIYQEVPGPNVIGTSITEVFTLSIVYDGDNGGFDSTPFDTLPLDIPVERIAEIRTNAVPPIPLNGATWSAFETPLTSGDREVAVIDVIFTTPTVLVTPTFSVWAEGMSSAWLISDVAVLGTNRFRLSIASPARIKVAAT